MTEFLEEVVLDGFLDVCKLLPFLFLTYVLMEFIEHKASGKAERFVKKAGKFGPLVGGVLGVVPQCGFSAAAANLYAGRILSMGTLVAVFLSTSDEMLPILLSEGTHAMRIFLLVGIKLSVGIGVGFLVDLVYRANVSDEHIHVDDLCAKDGCHCEGGILHSALHHTLHIGVFLLLISWAIGVLVFFVGTDGLATVFGRVGLSHVLAALIGLIPNCAASVALTKFYMDGLITEGALLSGLLPGAGVGLLILFRVHPRKREALTVLGVLVVTGLVVGLLADLTGLSAWIRTFA